MLNFVNNCVRTLVFKKYAYFVQKIGDIAENMHHNIGPWHACLFLEEHADLGFDF
jgi:hypothetical protein